MISTQARRLTASIATRGKIGDIQEEVQSALRGDFPHGRARAALDGLLKHAASTVPAYRGIESTDLQNFPVTSKADLKSEPSRFISSTYPFSALTTVSTSGSTGVPFVSYRDSGKRLRHRGSLVGSFVFQGADPFGPRIVSKAWGSHGIRPKIASFLQQEIQHSAGSVMEPSTLDLCKWLRKHPGALVMGYSSYLEQVMREAEEEGIELPLPVGALVGASEPASDYLVSNAVRIFGTPLRMRYSNMENGMIAVSKDDVNRYHVDYSSFKVEIIEENGDAPVRPGEIGRLVVTDLFNYGMPFIRYDTGDLAAWAVDNDNVAIDSVLSDIAGRRLDTITISDDGSPKTAHALQIWAPTAKLTEIRQFQLRQHAIGQFTWVLNARQSDSLEDALEEILTDRIGNVDHVAFKYVEDIPVLASGKRQFFVNEIENGG